MRDRKSTITQHLHHDATGEFVSRRVLGSSEISRKGMGKVKVERGLRDVFTLGRDVRGG